MRQPPNYGATAASSVARQKVGAVSIMPGDPLTACCCSVRASRGMHRTVFGEVNLASPQRGDFQTHPVQSVPMRDLPALTGWQPPNHVAPLVILSSEYTRNSVRDSEFMWSLMDVFNRGAVLQLQLSRGWHAFQRLHSSP